MTLTKTQGEAAMDAWIRAIETDKPEALAALCSPDLVFTIPIALPEWEGPQHGPERLSEFIHFEKSEIHTGMTVERHTSAEGPNFAAFQVTCSAQSRDTGEAFEAPLMVTFAFDGDGMITELREWTWNLQPEAVARQAGLI